MAGKLQHEIKKRHPFTHLEEEAYLNLMRTADALARGAEDLLKSFGLSGTQYNALRILRGAGPEGLACREVGERMVTRDPDITRLFDRLEKRGLLIRQRDKTDRRVVRTQITAAGLKALAEIDTPIMALHKQQLAHLGSTNLRLLSDLLEDARAQNPTKV